MLDYEITNVLARLVFDGDLEADDIVEAWSDLSALGVSFYPFDLVEDGPGWRRPRVAVITTRLRRRHATGSAYIRLTSS